MYPPTNLSVHVGIKCGKYDLFNLFVHALQLMHDPAGRVLYEHIAEPLIPELKFGWQPRKTGV